MNKQNEKCVEFLYQNNTTLNKYGHALFPIQRKSTVLRADNFVNIFYYSF